MVLECVVYYFTAMSCSFDTLTQVLAVCSQLYHLKGKSIMKEGVKNKGTKDIVSAECRQTLRLTH
jgi:hypothetical protein